MCEQFQNCMQKSVRQIVCVGACVCVCVCVCVCARVCFVQVGAESKKGKLSEKALALQVLPFKPAQKSQK